MNDVLSWVMKIGDLTITGALAITFIYGLFRALPRFMTDRKDERELRAKIESGQRSDYMKLLTGFGDRMVVAQELQAQSINRLSEGQARHEGMTSEGMDALQMAISSVDQRVARMERNFENFKVEMNGIDTVPGKIDQLIDEIRGKK